MSRAEAIELVRALTAAALNRDVDRLMSFYDPDAVAVSPVFGVLTGKNAIAASWQRLFSTLRNVQIEVSDVLVDSGRIAVISHLTATTGSEGWFGFPAHGASVDYRVIALLTVVSGRITREERMYDSVNLLNHFELARRDQELRLANDVQRELLPRTAMSAPFCSSVGRSLPCRAIGGDFFDFLDLPSGDVAIVVGDVAGKGPSAALLAAFIQGLLTVEATAGGGPADVLSWINRRLATRHIRSSFATLVYCVLSPNGQLTYCNAGHKAPALLCRNHVRHLTTGGPILGALLHAKFSEETIDLRSGDFLVMFTDGITEAINVDGDDFGDERLISQLVSIPPNPADLLDSIFRSVQEFCAGTEQSDDLTATVTQFI